VGCLGGQTVIGRGKVLMKIKGGTVVQKIMRHTLGLLGDGQQVAAKRAGCSLYLIFYCGVSVFETATLKNTMQALFCSQFNYSLSQIFDEK
jgi:hypothetical protein